MLIHMPRFDMGIRESKSDVDMRRTTARGLGELRKPPSIGTRNNAIVHSLPGISQFSLVILKISAIESVVNFENAPCLLCCLGFGS
jgi:hypothetical protein